MCGKCAAVGHRSEVCVAAYMKCCHCGEPHTAWNRKCTENLFQSEISQIMHTQKQQRFDATELVRRRFPNRTSSYASVARAGVLTTASVTVAGVLRPSEVRTLKHKPEDIQHRVKTLIWNMTLEHRRKDRRKSVRRLKADVDHIKRRVRLNRIMLRKMI